MKEVLSTIQDVLVIPNLLQAGPLQQIQLLISKAGFSDGRATATEGAQQVKRNLQIDVNDQTVLPLIHQLLGQALMQNTTFHGALLPIKLYPFLISKYEPGMAYGWHVDSPIMGNPPVRTDLAMTIFLSDPETYGGGELTLRTSKGDVTYKLNQGDAVVYPCQYLHCVAPLTHGERLAAVSWIQSAVRSVEHRAVLYNLKRVHEQLYRENPDSPQADLLLQTWSNLVRMWSEL